MIAQRRLVTVPRLLTIGGGMMIAAGALLPWLRLYGGLHSYAGITGLYGRVLLVVGVLAVILAMMPVPRARRVLSASLIGLGLTAAIVAATRLSATFALVSSGDAVMLVPSVGPGLVVALFGSFLVAAGGLTRLRVR